MNARKRKALTQAIYLVRLEYAPEHLTFHIVGSQKRVYQVTFGGAGRPDCTCPDSVQRKACCKHIHFVACKILSVDPSTWTDPKSGYHDLLKDYNNILEKLPHLHVEAPEELNKRYEHFLAKENTVAAPEVATTGAVTNNVRNSDCCICICSFDEISGELFACRRCRNAVHMQCWQQWESINKSGCCLYCREPQTQPAKRRQTLGQVTRDEYGVQL